MPSIAERSDPGMDSKERRMLRRAGERAAAAKRQASSRLRRERERYVEEWTSENARLFEEGGHYAWMAEQLNGHSRILEVGSGDGRGTLALLKAGHSLVSVDENPHCLEATHHRLVAAGFQPQLMTRGSVEGNDEAYRIKYKPIGESAVTCPAILVEGDVTNDPELLNWLARCPPFDGVACWLIGTHGARRFNGAIDRGLVSSPQDYRLYTENAVYELADSILRPGGVLHVVERGIYPDHQELIDDFVQGQRDQAKPTRLEIAHSSFAMREYEESQNVRALKMCATLTPADQHKLDLSRFALLSVKAKKSPVV